MDLGRRMRCSMSPSDIPGQSLATRQGVGYSPWHGDAISEIHPPLARRHGPVRDRQPVGLCEDGQAGVAEAGGRRRAIRAVGAGSQAGGAGGLL